MATQPSGAGFIIADKIIRDLKHRSGLRQEWESFDADIQAEIKHEWALLATEVLYMQATVIKHQREESEYPAEKSWSGVLCCTCGADIRIGAGKHYCPNCI